MTVSDGRYRPDPLDTRVTLPGRPVHDAPDQGKVDRQHALAARLDAIENALTGLERQLAELAPDWVTAMPGRYETALLAARSLLAIVQRNDGGELHLVVDVPRGITMRVARDGGVPTVRVVLVPVAAPIPPHPTVAVPVQVPARPAPAPGGTDPASGTGRSHPTPSLRPEIRAELERRRSRPGTPRTGPDGTPLLSRR